MESIPQAADEAYSEGDCVRIYLPEDDPDARYHGLVCNVIEDIPDELGALTGREQDSHQYRLKRTDTGTEISLVFRHEDLVPEAEWPERE
jgi:hypothetical protein